MICYQNVQWVETETNPENGVYGDISESNYIVGKKCKLVNLVETFRAPGIIRKTVLIT